MTVQASTQPEEELAGCHTHPESPVNARTSAVACAQRGLGYLRPCLDWCRCLVSRRRPQCADETECCGFPEQHQAPGRLSELPLATLLAVDSARFKGTRLKTMQTSKLCTMSPIMLHVKRCLHPILSTGGRSPMDSTKNTANAWRLMWRTDSCWRASSVPPLVSCTLHCEVGPEPHHSRTDGSISWFVTLSRMPLVLLRILLCDRPARGG